MKKRTIVENSMSCYRAYKALEAKGLIDNDKLDKITPYPFYAVAQITELLSDEYEELFSNKPESEDNYEEHSKEFFTKRLLELIGKEQAEDTKTPQLFGCTINENLSFVVEAKDENIAYEFLLTNSIADLIKKYPHLMSHLESREIVTKNPSNIDSIIKIDNK